MKRIFALIFIAGVCLLCGCGNLLDTVLADLPIATDIAGNIVTIVAPSNAAYVKDVTAYSGKVAGDLKLIQSLVQQYKADLKSAPADALGKLNAALQDVQQNLSAILAAVGVSDPKVTAAVAAAVDSVKLILNDVALLVKNNAPAAVSAKLFFGVPGMNLMAVDSAKQPKASGKSARQIAKEFNQKVQKDFPKAQVQIPKGRWGRMVEGATKGLTWPTER